MYNILRTEKVKSRAQITNMVEHNLRLRGQNNIDSSKSHLNIVLTNSLSASTESATDFQEKLSKYYEKLKIKEKTNNVLLMEFVVSASPEFFEKMSPADIKKWADHQVDFFKNEFGEQLKLSVLHLDEKTPHIHFCVSTEMKSIKKYKNQKGEFHKETWSLNADRYNPQFLTDLHTRHYEWNKKFKLKRGVKNSKREHKSLKEFYSMVDKALSTDYQKTITSTIENLQKSFFGNKVSIDELKDKFAPMINSLLKQNKTLKQKYSFDLKNWGKKLSDLQNKLDEEKEELEAERKELQNIRSVYAEAINTKNVDAKTIESLEEEVKALTKLVEKYKPADVKIDLPNGFKSSNRKKL